MAESQRTETTPPAQPRAPGQWARYSRAKRARYLAAGLCATCGHARDNGSLTCTRCLEKMRERGPACRAERRAKKLAEFGPKPPPAMVSADMAAYKRAWRAKHKAAGLCASCGASRDVEGRIRCRKCLDEDRASHERRKDTPTYRQGAALDTRRKCERRRQRIAEGLCGWCGGPDVVPGFTGCEPCLARNRKSSFAVIVRWRAAGLCVHCGREANGQSLCPPCLETTNVRSHARRTRVEANGGHLTPRQWRALKKAQGYRCLCCGRCEPEIKLTIDHVIPVSRGGNNGPENCQGLCGECNSSKGTRTTDYRK
jgi:5-methylcytosine-specific restriction endonuclease McrA